MNSFGPALEAALKEIKLSQSDAASLTSLAPSTISRLITGSYAPNAATLDALLTAFEDDKLKTSLVLAYLNDAASADARALLHIAPRAAKNQKLRLDALSDRGLTALTYILNLQAKRKDVEQVIIDFARALGWKQ